MACLYSPRLAKHYKPLKGHPELGPATWGEGDFTSDTLVNSADLFAMLGAANFNAGPYTTTASDSDSSLTSTTTTTTTSTSLLSTIDAGDENGTGDQFALASSAVFYFSTYGSHNSDRVGHRPGPAPEAPTKRANANTSKSDDSDDTRLTAARSRDVARSVAVDRLMGTFGRFTQPRKERTELDAVTYELSDSLLEDLTAGL